MNHAHRPDPDFARAEAKARSILSELGYNHPPINPLDIAKKLGIDVSFVSFPQNPDVSGFYDPSERRIYVNAAEGTRRQSFTIAHELGHALLHQEWAKSNEYRVLMRDMEGDKNDPKEKEANTFAANLLVPRNMLLHFLDKMSVKELADMFVVSEQMLGYRIYRVTS
ncbi:ImmA/IrrE family metallo-endopeptidase [Acetobacteraceae bacterium B3987]|nr:ImmA/IrrE family metallo-endopeptidase [Acetobacteraceae bacterium B3987]